jgi:hypothetical protein
MPADVAVEKLDIVEHAALLSAAVDRLFAAREETIVLAREAVEAFDGLGTDVRQALSIEAGNDLSRRFAGIAEDLGFEAEDSIGDAELKYLQGEAAELVELCRFFAERDESGETGSPARAETAFTLEQKVDRLGRVTAEALNLLAEACGEIHAQYGPALYRYESMLHELFPPVDDEEAEHGG